MSFGYGDVFDAVADAVQPSDPAIFCDGEAISWGQFSAASNALARAFIAAGLQPGAKVAQYMRNNPGYPLVFVAAMKARLAPVNVNYRYGPDELAYLLDNSDAEVVVFDADYADNARALQARMPRVKLWISANSRVDGFDFLDDLASGDGSKLDIQRSPDDMFLLYTGGTTGMPKGVMWPSSTWWDVLAAGRAPMLGMDPPQTLDALKDQIRRGEGRAPVYVAPPLMHGTGMFTGFGAMSKGSPIVLTRAPGFNPSAALDAMTRHATGGMAIVGDAFAKPMLDALRAEASRYDVRAMRTITSSGMMWSPEVKRGLFEFMPDVVLFDSFGASEGTGLGVSLLTRDMKAEEARFDAPNTVVVRPGDYTPIAPGSGEVGLVAKWGNLPLGYYKDAEKTARTYVEINGVRHLLSGDHATVEADGRIRLLGRGSHCINSGGEKIYPEEVEEALKTHPSIVDALVFGIPDERFGQSIAAIASLEPGKHADPDEVIAHVRARLSHYKAPRRIHLVEKVPRAPNGKPDYPAAKEIFAAAQA